MSASGSRPPRRALALGAIAVTVIAALGVLSLTGALPRLRNPFRTVKVPTVLDPRDPTVVAARSDAFDETDLLDRLVSPLTSAIPPTDQLWVTQTSFATDASVALWEQQGAVRFRSYAPFRVPANPTWAEDPHHNLSWAADYQSLGWLQAPARAYLETGDAAYRQQVKDYLLDWIADAGSTPPPSDRTWYDHAVAYRTDVIVFLLKNVLPGDLSGRDLQRILGALRQHAIRLDGYLRDPAFKGHNHNLFHALSLYNLATALPELRDAATWQADARARISSLLPEMVDGSEGASLEEAAGYHYLDLRLYAAADRYLGGHGDGLTAAEREVLDRMTAFGAALLSPSGKIPAIGDTVYGSSSAVGLLTDLATQGITSPTAQFVLSHGTAGTRPADALFYPVAGYAIVRPAYSLGDAWRRDVQLVVDTSAKGRPHGHDDAMNVLLDAEGGPLLVDSGGPYVYGAGQPGFVRPMAHNVVVDLASPAARPGAVSDLVETDDSRLTVIAGTVPVSASVQDRRIVVVLKPDTVVVVDLVRGLDGDPHDVELLYHFPPGASVVPEPPGAATPSTGSVTAGSVTAGSMTAGTAALGFRVAASGPLSGEVVEGQRTPPLGWVTTAYDRRTAAPVLATRQRGANPWFVTAFQPAPAGAAAAPGIHVDVAADGGLRIHLDGLAGELDVGPDGTVHLASS